MNILPLIKLKTSYFFLIYGMHCQYLLHEKNLWKKSFFFFERIKQFKPNNLNTCKTWEKKKIVQALQPPTQSPCQNPCFHVFSWIKQPIFLLFVLIYIRLYSFFFLNRNSKELSQDFTLFFVVVALWNYCIYLK